MSIVDIADEQVRQHHGRTVETIELEIGQLAGIEPDALAFAWDAGVRNTVLQSATRIVNYVQGTAHCPDCGQDFMMQTLYDACPTCGNYFNELRSGQELRVKSLIIN